MSEKFKQSQPFNDGESYIKVADLKKWLLLQAEYCEQFIIDTIKGTSLYKELYNIPIEDIPLHINDYFPGHIKHSILKNRLEGTDPFEKDLSSCMQILWDSVFDVEKYKGIGRNDGQIDILHLLLNKLGLKNESEKLSGINYSD